MIEDCVAKIYDVAIDYLGEDTVEILEEEVAGLIDIPTNAQKIALPYLTKAYSLVDKLFKDSDI